MAVVLTLALAGAIALFLLRRCRRNTRGGQSVPLVGDGTARKSGLDTDKPVQTPIYGQNGDIKPHGRPDELPANERRRVGLRESTGELQPGMMVHTVEIGSCPSGTFPYQRTPVLTWS
jgi:hypothetical protein